MTFGGRWWAGMTGCCPRITSGSCSGGNWFMAGFSFRSAELAGGGVGAVALLLGVVAGRAGGLLLGAAGHAQGVFGAGKVVLGCVEGLEGDGGLPLTAFEGLVVDAVGPVAVAAVRGLVTVAADLSASLDGVAGDAEHLAPRVQAWNWFLLLMGWVVAGVGEALWCPRLLVFRGFRG